MDAIQALKTRRSIRDYTPAPVDKSVIEDIVDCGRLAATARNVQPWEFVVVTRAETRARIADLVPNGPYIRFVPVCIAVLCKEGTYYVEDGCAATQNLLVAAHAHGLGSCWIAGDKKPYVDAVLEILEAPGGYKLVSLVCVGHTQAKPAPQKRALSEVIHWERF